MILLIGLLTVGGFYINKGYVRSQQWLVQLASQKLYEVQDQLGVELEWENISARLLLLQLQINKVKIQTADRSVFSNVIEIQRLTVSPDYMALFRGLITAKLTITKPQLKLNIGSNKKGQFNDINRYLQIESLKNFFITQLNIQSADIILNVKDRLLYAQSLNARIYLYRSKIQITSEVSKLKTNSSPSFFSSIHLELTNQFVDVHYLKMKNEFTDINVSMGWEWTPVNREITSFHTEIDSVFYPEDFMPFVDLVRPDFQLSVKGLARMSAQIQYNPSKHFSGQFDLSTEKFEVGEVFLSQVTAKGVFKDYTLWFDHLSVKKDQNWDVDFPQVKLFLKEPYHFQTQVDIQNSRFNSLFRAFNLKAVPVDAAVNGAWKCTGKLFDGFSFHCLGESKFNNFIVYSGKDKDNILRVPNVQVNGSVTLTSDQVFLTDVKAIAREHTHLHFSSKLEDDVFSAQYMGQVDFEDIENLIQLSPEGILRITDGSIFIDDDHLDIQSQIQVTDASLSQFRMGQVEAQLNYTKKGWLRFHNIKGRINQSNYTGNVRINIPNDRIKLFASFPTLTLKDLKYALAQRLHFPFELDGNGTLTAYLSGPLEINALSYSVDSRFSNVVWEREHFNQAIVQVESKDGFVKVKKAEAFKKAGKVVFTGTVNPKGDLEAQMIGAGLYLQESPNIVQVIGSDVMGTMDFNMNLKGFFLEPVTTVKTKVFNTSVKGYSLADSSIDLRLRHHQVEASGFVADKIHIKKLIFPYSANELVELKAVTNDLNIKQLFFHKADSSQLYNSFESSIDSELDIIYKRQQLMESINGHIEVKKAVMQANTHRISSALPFSIQLKKGALHIDSFILQSGTKTLNVLQDPSSKIIYVNGGLKTDFLAFLFPFMLELNGDIETKMSLKPHLSNLDTSGWIKLYNSTIHLHSELDPFEKVRSDMTIDKDKLMISFFSAQYGGGTLSGKGELQFKGSGNTPVNVGGSFTNVQFNSIDGINARGSGRIQLTGSDFPYTLGISGELVETKIDKEFASGIGVETEDIISKWQAIKKSTEDFEPIRMNLNMSLKNPVQVENSTIKSGFDGNIKIAGFPSDPILSGQLTGVPGGSVIFRDHEFEILSAQVNYVNSKLDQPQIDLRARSVMQEQSSTGDFSEEYSILLAVKGTGEQAEFTLTSTPELTKDEIVSLMAFGTRSAAFEQGDSAINTFDEQGDIVNNIAKYSYYHLGPVLFQKAIGQELKNTLGVDQFLIVPYVNPKKNTTSTKLILRKKMFKKLNVSASQTILDENPERDVKVEYKVNKNVSVVGFWKNEDPLEGSDLKTNALGFDLEYQVDF